MKQILVIVCSLIVLHSGIAQEVTPIWSNAIDVKSPSEGIPFDVVGDIDGTSYVVLSNSKRKKEKHLAISSFDPQMKQLKSLNLLLKYPKLSELKLAEKKCGNGKVFLGFRDVKNQKQEDAYILILNKDLTVFKDLKLIKSAVFKEGNKAVKIASLHVLINPADLKFPICVVVEGNSNMGEDLIMTATQFDINLKENRSLSSKSGVAFFSDKTLLTGREKYYDNFYDFHYCEAGVFGYLTTREFRIKGDGRPFMLFNFNTKKSYSKDIIFGNGGKRGFKVKLHNNTFKLFYTVQDEPYTTSQSMVGAGVLILDDKLEIIKDEVSIFSADQIKNAYGAERYKFEVEKGKRKLRTLRTIYSATTLNANLKIKDIFCSEEGDFITLSFSHYIAGKDEWTTKGVLVVKFGTNQKVAWLRGIYSELESYLEDSKLTIKNNQLILAYNSNVDLKNEPIDKKIRGASFLVTAFDLNSGEVGKNYIFNAKPNTVSKQGLSLFEVNGNIYFFSTPKGKKKEAFIGVIK
jgi:hypothetical protein